MSRKKKPPFPTREQVAAFVRESPTPVHKREIARAFHITGDDRLALKAMIRDLEEDGVLERGRGRRMAPPSALPAVTVVVVTGTDSDGEVLARPLRWEGPGNPPVIFMAPEKRGHPAMTEGDRALARLRRLDDGAYEGRTIKRLGETGEGAIRAVGIYEAGKGGGTVHPADKRRRGSFHIAPEDAGGATDGELVVVETVEEGRRGPRRLAVVDRLGDANHARAISLIALHAADIPIEFPKEAVEQAEAARPAGLNGRTDLRDIPFVTIDGADARDFDDAVWAEPDTDPKNEGGWHLMVAIADVAHYVTPGSPLDREAFRRGNSCYFPDRVVPMLPEALSNGLCSLRPDEERACLAVHLWIDAQGWLRRHRFVRGLMRSAARLTYEQVQAARDGDPDDLTGLLLTPVLEPLYGAYGALLKARHKRGTLDLDLPERTIRLDEDGDVAGIGARARLDSHRLIEEFMIAANVAAAETLEGKGTPCLFRVHDEPDPARLEALRQYLAPMGYRLAKGQVARPRMFTQILDQAEGKPEAETVSEMVLRSQAQAVYSPDNLGHFGLALPRYAHFTSPIRRYADLTVHRGLIRQLRLGEDGAPDEELARLEAIGEHISFTERRAAQAERDATDRYVAAYLSSRVGEIFSGKIRGVTRFGLFVTLDETGADGLVPIGTLPDDYYDHDEAAHALTGRRWGRVYRLGTRVRVRLTEANPLTGSTLMTLMPGEGEDSPDHPPADGKKQARKPKPPPKRTTRAGRAKSGGKRTR